MHQPKGYECLCKINKALYGLNAPLTCLARSKSTSEWPHLDLSIFKILNNQLLHRNWLSVHLVSLVTILSDQSGSNKHFVEQEYMKFLQ